MKLKTVVLAATLLAICCFALTSYGRAPTGKTKPKKTSTSGSVTTSGTTQASLFIYSNNYDNVTLFAAPPENGSFYYAFNSDYTSGTADLQMMLNFLKTGLGSTSAITSSDINGDGLVSSTASNSELSLVSSNPNPANFAAVSDRIIQPNFIPEPASAILAGCGLVVLLAARRRLQAG